MLLAGCPVPPEAELSLTADRTTFDGRFERAIVRVSALAPDGTPGAGVVKLTAAVGSFVEGSQLTLAQGTGSATYRCDPGEDPACSGAVRIGAEWQGVSRSLVLRVTPSDPNVRPRWSVVPTLQPLRLNAVATAPDGTVWAVGERGLLLPFRSGAWGTPSPTGVTTTLRALAIGADGRFDLAGDEGTLLSGRPGELATVQHSATSATFTGVARFQRTLFVTTADGRAGPWDVDLVLSEVSPRPLGGLVASDTRLVVFGVDTLAAWTGSRFEPVPQPVSGDWRQARLDSGGLWLLGQRLAVQNAPVLVQNPGADLKLADWRSTNLPPGEPRAMAWGQGSTDRFVVTDDSIFRFQEAIGWQDLEAPSGGRAIAALGGGQVLVVGLPGVSLLRVR
ncbi:MAG: hypothetical protein INH41_18685 [Myxococcaceae bacterium]|nr:hypothetical protein [Myxococcaceae bacterium]MCA3014415.1 hypothetical protein [Myxococcaceae bacterium]